MPRRRKADEVEQSSEAVRVPLRVRGQKEEVIPVFELWGCRWVFVGWRVDASV